MRFLPLVCLFWTGVAAAETNVLEGKHESLSGCAFVVLEPGEFVLFPNGTIRVDAYNLTLDPSRHLLSQGTAQFCTPFDVGEPSVQKGHLATTGVLTMVGVGISMVCLATHLAAFCVVPALRNLPGWNLATLCASLFLGYALLCAIGAGGPQGHRDACLAAAALAHFFLLASVLWMSVMSYDVCVSLLRATGSLRSSSTRFAWRRYGLYCLGAFGTALAFSASALLAETLGGLPESYRPGYGESCWFRRKTSLLVFFAGPVLVLTCLNFALFGLSACTLHRNKMRKEGGSVVGRRYAMYFRLSVIMGVTWMSGVVASVADADWAWYVFVALNTLQGLFVFLAFTCSKKVRAHLGEKLFGRRRGSEQTLAPTFQSYCFYNHSMDKVAESDAVVLHL